MTTTDHPPRRTRRTALLIAAGALVVFGMGSCTGALGHDTTPTETRTVEKRVTVPGPTVVPDDCLTALDAADAGFTSAGHGFTAASDGFAAVGDGNLAGLNAALADAKDARTDLESTVGRYTAARDACRAAAGGGAGA